MNDDPKRNPLVGSIDAPNSKIVIVNELHGDVHTGPRHAPRSDERDRAATLTRIRQDWIDGVLNQSLYRVARIELGLATREDVVESPLNAIVQIPDRTPVAIQPGTAMIDVFDQLGRSLLILGAPGTGKTTALLELAKGLLDRADRDSDHPIPSVFNLSTWAIQRKPLKTWLIAELNLRAGVPKHLAQKWISQGNVIPLLDGLDEVDPAHRLSCLRAINEFHGERGLLPIVVCSRTADFQALEEKLNFRGAVVVQLMTKENVDEYLARSNELAPVRTALHGDPGLYELLTTPLMLWVAMLAYSHEPAQISVADTTDLRRALLFEKFVTAMFTRRAVAKKSSQELALRWLSWLARSMSERKQTVFYLEDVDFDWFETQTQRMTGRLLVGGVIAIVVGMFLSFLVEIVLGSFSGYGIGVRESLKSWVGIGLIFGLIAVMVKLRPKETLMFSARHFQSRLSVNQASVVGALVCIMILVELGSSGFVYIEGALGFARRALFVVPVLFGLVASLGYLFVQFFVGDSPSSRRAPNQGTLNSGRTALFTMVLFSVLGGVGGWMLNGAPGGLTLAPCVGVSAGLVAGGLFTLKHFIIRVQLWAVGGAPIRYVSFLHEVTHRILMFRVGGGYIFVHRMLQEYLASLPPRRLNS